MSILKRKVSWQVATSAISLEVILFLFAFGLGIYQGANTAITKAAGDINVPAGSHYLYAGRNFGSAQPDKFNYFFGDAGNFNMTGMYNLAIGPALLHNTSGSYNVAIGPNALAENTTGGDNFAVGANALSRNTTGMYNFAVGANALSSNVGNDNVAIGPNALSSNTTGGDNFAVGPNALSGNTTGKENVAIGINALSDNGNGSGNFAVGTNAGISAENNNNSMYLGASTRPLQPGGTNEIVIGDSARGAGSNTVTLGNSSILKTVLQGKVGIGNTSPQWLLDVGNDAFAGPAYVRVNSAANRAAGIQLATAGTGEWYLYKTNDANNDFRIKSAVTDAFTIQQATGNIGIGTTAPAVKLDVNGMIRTAPATSTICNTTIKGGIYYNSTDNHFYGCNGTTWKQLDN